MLLFGIPGIKVRLKSLPVKLCMLMVAAGVPKPRIPGSLLVGFFKDTL